MGAVSTAKSSAAALCALALAVTGCEAASGTPGLPETGGKANSAAALRHCTAGVFPAELATAPWNHWGSALIAATEPWHSARDVLGVWGDTATVFGKFAYGPTSKDLQDEEIEVWIDDCADGYRLLGTAVTDSDGRIAFGVPAADVPEVGVYGLVFRVAGDDTRVRSTLRVFPAGTELMVFDIDATLTTSDFELIADVFAELFEPLGAGDYVPAARAGAADLTRLRSKQGYPLVFLTGRPYWLSGVSRQWLADEGIAPGTLMLAQSNSEALPVESGVGDYKAAYLRGLVDMGFAIEAAYGNASTDIYAYQQAGIPKARTFIVGENAGAGGTVDLGDDYAAHLPVAAAEPDADQPFSW